MKYMSRSLLCLVFTVLFMPQVTFALQETDPSKITGAQIDESAIERIFYVATSGSDDNIGSEANPFLTIGKGFSEAEQSVNAGVATKLVIKNGIYRDAFNDGITFFDGIGKTTLLVIEGESADNVIISGSDVFDASEWTVYDAANNIYETPWPYNFGFQTVNFGSFGPQNAYSHRSEMMFVNGQPLKQQLIERHNFWNNSCGRNSAGQFTCQSEGASLLGADPNSMGTWDYQGFTNPSELQPGTFGVAERTDNGNKLYVRLPNGVALEDAMIEASVRKQLLGLGHKENVVIRNLTFQHTANHDSYAIAIKEYETDGEVKPVYYEFAVGFDGYEDEVNKNILIDNVKANWNNGHALTLYKAANVTVRNSEFNYNGYNGARGDVINMIWDGNDTSFNGWRGADDTATGSWYIAGAKFARSHDVLFENSTVYGNLAPGLWCDIICTNLIFDNISSAYNTRNIFIELGVGPYLVQNSIMGPASKDSILIGNATDVLVRDSIIYGDTGKTEESSAFSVVHYQRNDNHANEEPGLRSPRDIRLESSVIASPRGQQNAFKFHNGYLREDNAYALLNQNYSGLDNIFYSDNSVNALKHYQLNTWNFVNSTLSGWEEHILTEENARFISPNFANPLALDFSASGSSPAANILPSGLMRNLGSSYSDLNASLYNFFTWKEWDKFELSHLLSGASNNASATETLQSGNAALEESSGNVVEAVVAESQPVQNSFTNDISQQQEPEVVTIAAATPTASQENTDSNNNEAERSENFINCQVSDRDINEARVKFNDLCSRYSDAPPMCSMIENRWNCRNFEATVFSDNVDVVTNMVEDSQDTGNDNTPQNITVAEQTETTPTQNEEASSPVVVQSATSNARQETDEKCEVHSGDYNSVMQRFANECGTRYDVSQGHQCITTKNVWYCTTSTEGRSQYREVNEYNNTNSSNNAQTANANNDVSRVQKCEVHSGDYNSVMQRFANECGTRYDVSQGHQCITTKNVWYCTTSTEGRSQYREVNEYNNR